MEQRERRDTSKESLEGHKQTQPCFPLSDFVEEEEDIKCGEENPNSKPPHSTLPSPFNAVDLTPFFTCLVGTNDEVGDDDNYGGGGGGGDDDDDEPR
nr:unnamed protein product [Spirometra erinaceieuropaei]